MTVAVPLSLGVSLYLSAVGDRRWDAAAARSRADWRSAHFYRRRKQWSRADPGPVRSHSAFWGWKEKTSLPAADHASNPSSLPPPEPSLPPSSPPSLPPRFPSTLPASSTLQGLSRPREGKQTAKENLPTPLTASAVQCTQRERERERGVGGDGERWGRRWRDKRDGMEHMVWIHKLLFVCLESLHRPHCLRVVSGWQLLPAEHLETHRGRIQFVCVCVCVCVWEVWRGGWGVLNEYKVKTKKEKQKEENSSWTKLRVWAEIHLVVGGEGGETESGWQMEKKTQTHSERGGWSVWQLLREKSKKWRGIFNQRVLELLIKTYCKKRSHQKTVAQEVRAAGGDNVSLCVCVYKPVSKSPAPHTLPPSSPPKIRMTVFVHLSSLLSFSSPLPSLLMPKWTLCPSDEGGKIGLKSSSCLLSVIMRGWASSAPCPQCHHTHKPSAAKSAS